MSRFTHAPEKRAFVWRMYKAGSTYNEIGQRFGMTKSAVAGLVDREKRRRDGAMTTGQNA